jgi:hypothetical protein
MHAPPNVIDALRYYYIRIVNSVLKRLFRQIRKVHKWY